jgi:hypothetical protein
MISLPQVVENRLAKEPEPGRSHTRKTIENADLHHHYTAAALARRVVVETLLLGEVQHGAKRMLADAIAADDHRAHLVAHALYELCAHSEGGRAKVEGLRAALAEVSPEAARLLGSHHMRSVSRGGKEDDHVAHAMTRAALLKLREYEAAGAAGEEG